MSLILKLNYFVVFYGRTFVFLRGSQLDFILVLMTVATVLVAELFNTAIERMVDLIQPERHYLAGIVKDVAAGFVLMAIVFAFFIGVLIFYPLMMSYFTYFWD